ncbi:conserved hypothetical protein [Deferribacter desulfuricans SSM1]|uniref:Outer membrane lipoprotein carrier protein n=1 Tax=Deferribacter desulfuricans (strain DSM 14783 / JCM 11476 / NBRC 101012 / SSM1) TaxID=639282 RepID=D3PB06_DEFDS|nr:outer membrane lipoprotein carrier protein LolA [Deferribacter desulfuricans]BAI79779.1 conserved hypothetical protein [Deferribacter desulfuricans SSM1]
MRKIKIFIILIFLLIPCVLFANDVDNLINKYSKIKTIQANFLQKTLIKGFGEEYYSGKVYLIKGERLLWNYTSPYWQYYLFQNGVMEYYDSSLKQLMRQKINFENNVILQLIMDLGSLKKNFNVSLLNEDRLKLIPKNEIGIKYILLDFDNTFVKTMKSEDDAGNFTEIVFKDVLINKNIDESVFEIVVPLDTEVFDYTK